MNKKTVKRYICGCHPRANDDNCTNLKGHGLFAEDIKPQHTHKETTSLILECPVCFPVEGEGV